MTTKEWASLLRRVKAAKNAEKKAKEDYISLSQVVINNMKEAGVKKIIAGEQEVTLVASYKRSPTFDSKTFLADHPEYLNDTRYWKDGSTVADSIRI
jgi:aspartate/glutamate racemase